MLLYEPALVPWLSIDDVFSNRNNVGIAIADLPRRFLLADADNLISYSFLVTPRFDTIHI